MTHIDSTKRLNTYQELIDTSTDNWNMRNLNVSVVVPTRLRIIKHEMTCYISYVKHQLYKDAAVYFCRLAVSTAGATLAINII